MRDVRQALMIARNSDGKLVHRPLSPHIQVYRWPISMALSILHRASGVALGVGTLLMAWWLLSIAGSDTAYAIAGSFIGSPIGLLLLFGWSVALLFHLFSGIRHLFWDAGIGFDAPAYNNSGWFVIVATAVSVLLVWIIGFWIW